MVRFAFLLLTVAWVESLAQDAHFIRSLVENEGEIRDFTVEQTRSKDRSFLLTILSGRRLHVYDSDLHRILETSGYEGIIAWEDGFFADDTLYLISSGLQGFAFGTNGSVTRQVYASAGLAKRYSWFHGYHDGSKRVLLAGNDDFIDVYSFPHLALIRSIQRKTPHLGEITTFFRGFVIYSNTPSELAAVDPFTGKSIWQVDAGEKKPHFLGISFGSVPNRWAQCVFNPDDSTLVAATFFGDLYKIALQSGAVLLRQQEFRGNGNNAGLLTRLYLHDMNSDGKREIVAPSVDENVYCINPSDFSVLWESDTGNENQMPLAFFDCTGDGIPEVFGVNDYDLTLSIINGRTGERIRSIEIEKKDRKFQQTPVRLMVGRQEAFSTLYVQSGFRVLDAYKLEKIANRSSLR